MEGIPMDYTPENGENQPCLSRWYLLSPIENGDFPASHESCKFSGAPGTLQVFWKKINLHQTLFLVGGFNPFKTY